MMMRDAQPGNIYLKDYSAPRYLIDKTALRVDIRQDDTVVLATLDVRRNPDANDRETSLVLDGQGLSLQSLSIDGKPLTPEQFSATADELLIHNVPEQFTLTSEVIIRPKENSSLEGLFKSRTIYCTQCEAEGFRGITYYLDRPDVMSEFTTTVVAD